jgi:glycosyltransferase involved in cell wall biosynthesis
LVATGVDGSLDGHSDRVELYSYVPRIEQLFRRSGVYVQPSVFDPFSVATLEAMRAGLPCVVTQGVGAKEIIGSAHQDLVSDTSADGIANAVRDLWDREFDARLDLSDSMRALAEPFVRERSVCMFRAAISELVTS